MQVEAISSEPLYPRSRSRDPYCRKLALAILLQAFRDVLTPRQASWKKGEDWHSDALDWFNADVNDPGSFCWVCDHLHLDPFNLRGWLRRYEESSRRERKELARRLVRFQIPRSA